MIRKFAALAAAGIVIGLVPTNASAATFNPTACQLNVDYPQSNNTADAEFVCSAGSGQYVSADMEEDVYAQGKSWNTGWAWRSRCQGEGPANRFDSLAPACWQTTSYKWGAGADWCNEAHVNAVGTDGSLEQYTSLLCYNYSTGQESGFGTVTSTKYGNQTIYNF